MESLIGAKLGQYEIREKIGQGGMAYVFKGYQASLDRFVAVKVLSPTLAKEPGFTERFQREARSVARLHHPNILQVHDYGRQDHYHYLVMHYVKNSVTLGSLIRNHTPIDELIEYIVQVADALNYAHQQGIIHRDVKPSNILIDGKWALLSDFGLVKMAEADSQLTGSGVGIGTPAYMSPEQATGRTVDSRTDIYALGIILYRILTGTVPHDAPTPLAIAIKRSTEPVPPPRTVKADVPESLEHVTLRALAIKPEARYSTATDFAQALKTAKVDRSYRERTVTDMLGEPTMVSTADEAALARTPKKVSLLAGGAVVAVALLAALVLLAWFLWVGAGSFMARSAAQALTPAATTRAAIIPPSDTPIPPTATIASPTATPVPPTATNVPAAATPAPPGAPSAIAKTRLEVRSGPGDEYDLLGYLPAGAAAEITSQDEAGQWWRIKISLTAAGVGWIRAGAEFTEAVAANGVPIALAPPTPTPTHTVSPTPMPAPDTPTPTATPSPSPTRPAPTVAPRVAATPRPTPTAEPTAPAGQFVLLEPASLDKPSFGPTEFKWQWPGPLAENQGFEVRVWRDGEPPAGVHNSVLDNQNGAVEALGSDTYRLLADITDTPGVRKRSSEYNWTVVLVQIAPEYKDLGIQAPPGRLRFDLPGAGGSSGGDGGSGGGGDPGSF